MSFLIPSTDDGQRLLGVYSYYRLFLGLLLGAMHWTGLSEGVFGYAAPRLFSAILSFYIITCVLVLLLYWTNTLKTNSKHLLSLLIFDFIALVTMIYAGGNLSDGLGYLLLIPMAIGSTFFRGQTIMGLAAFGTILVLGMSLLTMQSGFGDSRTFFLAGITGVSLFVTAIVFRAFSQKIKSSQHTAKTQTEQANYLQLISQRIIETMRTGIIVINHNLHIQLINHAAETLLAVDDKFEGLPQIKPIYDRLLQWQHDGAIPVAFSFTLTNHQNLKVSFAALNDPRFPSMMLFIEDMQYLNQAAQQLKLASLGKLTASIAHEIRNPLGAISHASQLLSESNTFNSEDQNLLNIIENHSKRINFIINNILDFSRRKNANPQIINLNQWLADFKIEYQQHHKGEIRIQFEEPDIDAKIDPDHLFQMINNLVDNGMRYSQLHTGKAQIEIHIGIQQKDRRPFIDIIDYGQGIDSDNLDKVFEPFYTTEATGSGLGLYLCKELSEANQATLSYRYNQQEKTSTFKLTVAHPKKQIVLQ